MIDLSKTPLSDQQIAILAVLKTPLWHNNENGNTYVSKRYWYGISQTMREALSRACS